ncbi:MAG: hypothetical protein AAGU74_05270 [Bacillota bacterium]
MTNEPNLNGPNLNEPNPNGPNINESNYNGPNPNGPNPNGPNFGGPNFGGPNSNGPNFGPNVNGPSVKKTSGLHGFAKGFVIFMIVCVSAAIASMLNYRDYSGAGTILVPLALFFGIMITGLALMLKGKAYGFWVLLAGSFFAFLMTGASAGGLMVSSAGGLVLVIITFFLTNKQLGIIRFSKKPGEQPAPAAAPEGPQFGAAPPSPAPEGPQPDQVPPSDIPGRDQVPPQIYQAPPQAYQAPQLNYQAPPPAAQPQPQSYQAPSQPYYTPRAKAQAEPRAATQAPPTAAWPGDPQSPPVVQEGNPHRRTMFLIIGGGIAVFVLLVVALLVLSRIAQQNVLSSLGVDQPTPYVPVQQTQPPESGLSEQQKAALIAEINEKLFAAIQEEGPEVSPDPVFLAAIKSASYSNVVLSDYDAVVTLLLPDPSADSLSKLNIPAYAPGTGGRAYIRENYAKLLQINTPGVMIQVDVRLPYQTVRISGEQITIDWSMGSVYFALNDYYTVFAPHVDEYMTGLGFYEAAQDALLPDFQSWPDHTGYGVDTPVIKAYFDDLANALMEKGVQHNDKLTVDHDEILELLQTRLAATFAYGSLSIKTEYGRPQISYSTPSLYEIGSDVYQALNAQFETGKLTKPDTLAKIEPIYLNVLLEKINAVRPNLDKTAADQTLYQQDEFDWQALGEKGVASCPGLVDDLANYLNAYDFHLMFTAHPITQ